MPAGLSMPVGRPPLPNVTQGAQVAAKPGRARTPQTTVINGQTYTYGGQKPPNLGTEYQMGDQLEGPDGSLWRPMPLAGAGAGRTPGPGGDPGGDGGYDIDVNKLWGLTPPAPAPQVPKPIHVQGPGLEDATRSQSLQFGRAKDRIGKLGRGSMKALANMFASRGLSGSGHESKALADEIGGMRGELADVVTNQALESVRREAAIHDRDYAGGLSQRGQDIGIDVGNADRVTDAHKTRLNLLQQLLSLRRSGARIY